MSRRKASAIGVIIIASLLAMITVVLQAMGGTNAYTPPGHEGYVQHQPLWIGHRVFVDTQTGPASTGWRWRQFATNIDMRPRTYSEAMQIFSADNLNVSFEAHARIRLRPGRVREVVERYSGDDWYANNVQRPYRTAVREIVRQNEAFQIKDRSEALGGAIRDRLRHDYEGTPFEVLSVSIGNIDYPEAVEQRVVANLEAEQRRQRMEVARQIAAVRAEIRETRAHGEAQAQEIEQATLTPLFVQHEAADLYASLADETDDDDGTAHARVMVVVPTRGDAAGIPRIHGGR